MPYKHIAAHLKKTELACRLHYHQLSHGSNRRRRTASISSVSSSGHSPVMSAVIPSPIREHSPREMTPPSSSGRTSAHSPDLGSSVKLPSILGHVDPSARLPAILPKPAGMGYVSESQFHRMPTPGPEMNKSLEPSAFPRPASQAAQDHHTLRLDCSLPAPTPYVDMGRLQAVYSTHRMSFWGAVAADYGAGASPIVLEQAWKSAPSLVSAPAGHPHHNPITPATSPNDREGSVERQDRTRISAILGINANPRSPSEREMVRRLEEERTAVFPAIARA